MGKKYSRYFGSLASSDDCWAEKEILLSPGWMWTQQKEGSHWAWWWLTRGSSGQKSRRGKTTLPCTSIRHRQKGRHLHSPPNHWFSDLHDSSVDLCKKPSAYGRASSEKYGWFWSDVLGCGFINRWKTFQLKPPKSPVELRSSMQMCCFRKSADGKPLA